MQKRSKKSWSRLAARVTLGLLVAGGTLGWAQGASAETVLHTKDEIDSYISANPTSNNTVTINSNGVDIGINASVKGGAGYLYYEGGEAHDVSSNTLFFTNTLAKYGNWYGGYASVKGGTSGSIINLENNKVFIGLDKDDDTVINLGGKNGEYGSVAGANGSGSAAKNVQSNSIVMYTGKVGSLYGGSGGELTKNNTVTMHNGEVSSIYGARSETYITISQETWEVEDTVSSLGAMRNTVNIYNGTVRSSITGGYAYYKANSNTVNISGGNVGAYRDENDGKTYYRKTQIVGGQSDYSSYETFKSEAKNNNVTIEFSDNSHFVVTEYIIGGYGYGIASNNMVTLTNGTYFGGSDVYDNHIMIYVAGGYTYKGTAENNQVIINDGLFSTDETEQYHSQYHRPLDSMIITGGLATSTVYNADEIREQGTIQNNIVTINGGKFGRTTDNYATTGAELLVNGSIVGGTVEAGGTGRNYDVLYKGNANIIHNTVNVAGGNIYANVLGGYTAYGDNKKNIVNITGGNITGSVYGGGYSSKYGSYSSSDIIIKGKVITDNNVNIGNGSKLATIGGNVYGGYIKASSYNSTSSNGKTTITGADVQRNSVSVGSNVDVGGNVIAGGYMTQEWKGSASGIVNNNSVTIRRNSSDSAINAAIYGGYNYYGDATNNKVTITGGTIGSYVYGAYSSKGEATGNTINISGNTDLSNANIFGGYGSTSSGNTLNLYTVDNDVKNQWTKNTVKSIQNVQRINLGTIDLTKGPAINAQSYLILPNVEIHLDGITGSGNIITSSSICIFGEDPKVYINGVQQANVGGGNVTAYDNTGVVITKEAGIEIGQKYLSYVSAEGGTGKIVAGIYTSKDGKVYVHDNVTGDSTAETGSLTLATSPEEGAIVAGAYNEAIDTAKANATGGTLTLGAGTYTGNFYAGYSKNGAVTDNKIVLQAGANVSGAKLYGSNTEGGTNNVLDANALTTTTNINSINNFNIIKLGSGILNLIGTDASNLAGATIELTDKTTARTLLSGNITGVDSLTINGVNKNAGVNYAKKEATNSVTKVTSGGWDVTGSGNNVQVAIKAGSEGNEIAGLYIASDGKKYSYADNTSGNATSGTLKLGTVTVAEGKTYAGAYAEAGDATGGVVEISGAVNGAVFAGYAKDWENKAVKDNTIKVLSGANLSNASLIGANNEKGSNNVLDLSAWSSDSAILEIGSFNTINVGALQNITLKNASFYNTTVVVSDDATAGVLFKKSDEEGAFSTGGILGVTGFSTDGRSYTTDSDTNGVRTQGGLQASITKTQIALVAGAKGNNIAGVYYDSEGVGHNKDGKDATSGALTIGGLTVGDGMIYAGAYAEGTQAATGGTVNITGNVIGTIYAGYAERGAVNNNTMNISANMDASETNLYGRNESTSGSGNVLNMFGANIKVGVVDRFDTINIGSSADAATSVEIVGDGKKLNAADIVTKGTTTVTANVEATNLVANGATTVTGNVKATTVTAKSGMTVNGNVAATDINVSGGDLNLNGTTNTVDNLKAVDVIVGNSGTVTVNKSIEATSVNAGTGAVNLGTSASTSTVKVDTVNAGTGTVNINASGNVDVNTLVASGTSKININSGNLLMNSVNMDGVATGNVVVGEKASVTGIYASLFKDDGSGLSANAQKLALNNTSMVIDNGAADAKVMSIDDVIDLDKKVQSATVKVSDESKLKRTVSIGNLEQAGDTYKELIEQSTVEAQKFVLVGIDASKVDGTIDKTKADTVNNNLSVAKLVLNQEAAGDVNGIAIAGGKEVTLVGTVEGGNVIEVKDNTNKLVDKPVTVLVGSKEAGTLNLGKTGSNLDLALKGNIQIEEAGTLNVNNNTKVTGNVELAGTKANTANVNVAEGKTTEITGDLKVSNAGNNLLGNVKVGENLVLKNETTVLNVGSANAVGKLNVKTIKLNGGTIFLDPAFVPGKSIEGASSLEVNTDSIDGKYIAGKNSVVAFGTMEGATEAFNKFAEVNSIEWAEDGVRVASAAMYIANNVTLDSGLGALMVDGSLTSAPAVTAGSAQFKDNSLLMVNGSATQSTAAISGATSLNVAGSAKLYISGAEKENTYKIVAGSTGIAGDKNNWAVDNVLTDSAKIKFINASTADLVAYNAYSVSIVDAYDGKVIIDNVLDAADDDPKVNVELKQFIDKATSNKTFDEAHQINAMDSLGAMNELGGVSHATQLAMEELSNIVANSAPLGENVGGKGVSAKTEKSKNVWAKLVHKKDKVASLNVGGMAAKYNVNLNGVVVGSDLYDDGTKSAGVALSYMDGKVTGYNMDVKTRNDAKYYGLAMYGRMQQGKARLLGDVTYLHGDNDLEQYNVVKASGKAKSDAISVGVRAEADMKLGAGKMTPYTGLRYTRVGIGKYHNSLGLQYDADVQNLVNIPLGLKYSADIKRGAWTIRPSVDVGYVWNLGDRNSTERVSYGDVTDTFGYSSVDKGRFVGGLNVAVETANISYSLGYDYNRSSNTKANRFNLGFQCKF